MSAMDARTLARLLADADELRPLGAEDELGTLNYLDADELKAGTAAVRRHRSRPHRLNVQVDDFSNGSWYGVNA